MKKLYIYLLYLIGLTGCSINLNNSIKEVFLYENATVKKIDNKKYTFEECCSNIERQYTLLITENDINTIKHDEIGIEFIFKSTIEYTFSPINKTKKFNKVFIPLSGEYKNFLFLGDRNGYGAYTPYGLANCQEDN